MKTPLPTVSGLRESLLSKTHAEVKEISRISGVPFTTLWKIRDGTTTNPGIETVRGFYKLLGSIKAVATPTEAKAA